MSILTVIHMYISGTLIIGSVFGIGHYLLFMKDVTDTVTSVLEISFVLIINHFYDTHNY